MGIFLILTAMISNSKFSFALHHGASPPMATLGVRSISIDHTIEPKMPVIGQDTQLTLHLTDGKAGQKIQSVAYLITTSKDFQLKP
jgi:hypothetical protein